MAQTIINALAVLGGMFVLLLLAAVVAMAWAGARWMCERDEESD